MSIIKLVNEGDTLTMTVKACRVVKGTYGEQVQFDSTDGDTLYLPHDSAVRQLERLTLTPDTATGEALTFSRDHNPKPGSKPFWGISPAKAQAQPSKRIPPPSGAPAQGVTRASLPFDLPEREHEAVGPMDGPMPGPLVGDPWDGDTPYRKVKAEEPAPTPREHAELAREDEYLALWSRVAEHQAAVGKALGFPVDGSSVQAATYSIWGLSGRGR
jgi:hypothetical protein